MEINSIFSSNSEEPRTSRKRKYSKDVSSCISVSEETDNRVYKKAVTQLDKLEFEQKVLTTDKKNNIKLFVDDVAIKTDLPAKDFLLNFKQVFESAEMVSEVPFGNHQRLILRKKPLKDEVKIYFDNQQKKLAEGGKAFIRKIVRIGSNNKKAIKETQKIRHNKMIDSEKKNLENLHKKLPLDPFFGGNSFKHLGIVDGYSFGKSFGESKNANDKNYIVGTLFQQDGIDVEIKNKKEVLSIIFQLAFGLKALCDMDLFENDLKADNTLVMRDENFPLGGIKIVLSDIDPQPREVIEEGYLEHWDFTQSFGDTYTVEYLFKEDIEKMNELQKQLKSDLEECNDQQEPLDEIFELRRKNMVSLLGQSFCVILTKELFDEMKNPNETIFDILNEVIFNDEADEDEIVFCDEITSLIMKMGDRDYKKRPSAKEVLSSVVNLVKAFDKDLYKVIENNRWLDGYGDWNDDLERSNSEN